MKRIGWIFGLSITMMIAALIAIPQSGVAVTAPRVASSTYDSLPAQNVWSIWEMPQKFIPAEQVSIAKEDDSRPSKMGSKWKYCSGILHGRDRMEKVMGRVFRVTTNLYILREAFGQMDL